MTVDPIDTEEFPHFFFSKSPQVTYSGYTQNNNDVLSIITNTYYVNTIEAYTEEALLLCTDIFPAGGLTAGVLPCSMRVPLFSLKGQKEADDQDVTRMLITPVRH